MEPMIVARVLFGVVMGQVLYCENGGNDSAMALVFEMCFADASIAQLLLQLEPDLSYEIDGVTSLELKDISLLRLAAYKGSLPATSLLLRTLKKYYDQSALFDFVRASDGHGRTALHFAAEEGHASLIWPLLQAGSSVMQRNLEGRTALDVCGGGACAEPLLVAMEEMERVRLLIKVRAVSDEAHRVASSLRLAHLLRKAEKEEDNEEERREEKRLSRRMTAFILREKTPYVKVHGQEKGMVRQPRQQSETERAVEGDVEEKRGMHM